MHRGQTRFAEQANQRSALVASLQHNITARGTSQSAVVMLRVNCEAAEYAPTFGADKAAAVLATLQRLGEVFRFGQTFLLCICDTLEAVEDSARHIQALVQADVGETWFVRLDCFSADDVLCALEA